MVEISPTPTTSVAIPVAAGVDDASVSINDPNKASPASLGSDAGSELRVQLNREALEVSAMDVEAIINTMSPDTSVSFKVEEELSRMVVTVREVGSDEIIRQFPPEEFITVAKHIAAQNPDLMDEDYLKGILFDQRT
jgi:uncharacterized FlaG/YvyC family protein